MQNEDWKMFDKGSILDYVFHLLTREPTLPQTPDPVPWQEPGKDVLPTGKRLTDTADGFH